MLLGVSLVAAIALEVGTLIGARTASPFVLSDWSRCRMAVFFILCLVICSFLSYCWRTGRLPAVTDLRSRVLALFSSRFASRIIPVLLFSLLFGGSYCALNMFIGAAFDYRILVTSFCFGFLLSSVIWFWDVLKCRADCAFLLLSVTFGVATCVSMPVMAEISYDGQIHFNYALAQSFLVNAEYSGSDRLMTDAQAVDVLGLLESGDLTWIWSPSQELARVEGANELLASADDGSVEVMEGTSALNGKSWVSRGAVGYIPSALGLWLGRLLHLPCLGQYLLARLVSLIVYILVVFAAIRRLRRGRYIVATLGLLPAPLLIACNFSYDPWFYSWIMYSFSRYVGCLQAREGVISTFDRFAVVGSFTLGALVKPVVFPLALALFVPPKGFYKIRRNRTLMQVSAVLAVLVLLAVILAPFVFASEAAWTDPRGGAEVSSSGQLVYILSNPFEFAHTFFVFCIGFFSPQFVLLDPCNLFTGFPYITGDVGRFGLLAIVEFIALVLISLIDRDSDDDESYRRLGFKAATALGLLGSFLLIVVSMYAAFTAVGADYIAGVQQRYILPLLPALCLILLNTRFFSRRSSRVRGVIGAGFILFESVALSLTMYNMFLCAF